MPAVKNVGARFIAPACQHTVRWAMYTNCGRGPFASSTAAVVRRAAQPGARLGGGRKVKGTGLAHALQTPKLEIRRDRGAVLSLHRDAI